MSNYSVLKLHDVAWLFAGFDYVTEMTAKKLCKYGKCRPFEHFLNLYHACFLIEGTSLHICDSFKNANNQPLFLSSHTLKLVGKWTFDNWFLSSNLHSDVKKENLQTGVIITIKLYSWLSVSWRSKSQGLWNGSVLTNMSAPHDECCYDANVCHSYHF